MPADPSFPHELAWFKSSHSGGNTTECVEAAFVPSGGVLIRDSKWPEGSCLAVSEGAWEWFVTAQARSRR
ncbi:hypothetical protein GCM10014715_69530 [Streptomyces spiralis]|uniref:DUF397 domain-containing protein n=1 Tax=Streptomyces spiralis TaxID=66376 RepID=A0A919DZZ5_9ACTN|nr:DUF397 domain-containing protein [Streptomyces spiralis]GHF03313.1 hypothetical protein GCM10014715_69530 [Streptomyces spiralis]